MNLNDFLRIRLSVGCGKNDFSMSRGSFRYRRSMTEKQQLRPLRREKIDGGYRLVFADKNGEEAADVTVTETDGKIRVVTVPRQMRWNRFRISFPANPEEHIYGCGETHAGLDVKGERVRIFVAEHQNTNRIGRKLIREKVFGVNPGVVRPFGVYESYYAQPTFVSSDCFYLHADISAFSEFDFTKPGRTALYTQEPPDFTVESADSFPELSEKLSALIGRQSVLPDWIYDGAILAVQRGTQEVEDKLAAARGAGAKICGVWSQDWCGCRKTGFGYQVMWNWEWDRQLYPGLDEKIKEWRAQGVRFLGYINPFLALEKDLYKYAAEHGYCVKDREGKDYLVTITTFPAAMVDLTNPDARNWYKTIIRENMVELGLGGWMADFGEYLPLDCVLYSGEDPEFVHNRWPAMWARLNREVIEECGVTDDVFFFTRAGHTGTVAASTMMWTGDQHVDWSADDGLPSVIPATLSLAMSGFGITHSDAGGYTTVMHMRRTKELLLRWEELCAFSPLYRFHEGNQPALNVQFDGDAELLAHLAWTSRIHAALKPYLKECVAECAAHGTPVMRPLFYHYDRDRAFRIKTEYLLGRDVLVAPVTREGNTSRVVYLPDDIWIHAFTGEEYRGGEYSVDAPIGRPPVFVRKGSAQLDFLLRAISGQQ